MLMNIKIDHLKILLNLKKKSTDRKGYILDDQKFSIKPVIVDYFI